MLPVETFFWQNNCANLNVNYRKSARFFYSKSRPKTEQDDLGIKISASESTPQNASKLILKNLNIPRVRLIWQSTLNSLLLKFHTASVLYSCPFYHRKRRISSQIHFWVFVGS